MNMLHLRLLFLFCLYVDVGQAQMGTDCNITSDCHSHQHCVVGYCQCEVGFIKNIHHCFKIRQHGQHCFYDAQCVDFRMLCKPAEDDPQKVPRCECDSFHEWNSELESCVQAMNVSEIMRSLGNSTDLAEDIDAEAQKVFFGLVVAGLSAVGSVLLFVAVCAGYGCCCRKTHSRLFEETSTKKDQVAECAVIGYPQGTYAPITTDFTPVV